MICFYHSADLDGHCSGAIINKYFDYNIDLIGIDYGYEFPWDTIKKDESVFMVDFTLHPFEDMIKLNNMCKLVWIDHHTTAINDAKERSFQASSDQFLEIGRSACELTWEYFYPNEENEAVRLFGRYDVWDLQANTLELQQGIRLFDTLPTNVELWSKLLTKDNDKFLNDIIDDGKLLLKKQTLDNEIYAKSCSFEVQFDGLNCVCINRGFTNSNIFYSVYNSNVHDAMLLFVWSKDRWKISLYTDKKDIDVSSICKKRGGGGHKSAAGFQCKQFPFELK